MITLFYSVLAAWVAFLIRLFYLKHQDDKRDNVINYDGDE